MRNRNMKEQIIISTPILTLKGTKVIDFHKLKGIVYVYNTSKETGRILIKNGYVKVHYIKKLRRHLLDLVVYGSANIPDSVEVYNSIINDVKNKFGGNK